MNFNFWPPLAPIRVLMVNPLLPSSKMIAIKILSGKIFGAKQLVDITFLVYLNEMPVAEGFIQELMGCNFRCMNLIVATSDLPNFTDADVICFTTDFPNPNVLDFDNLDTEDQFDSFYLIIKVAHSLSKTQVPVDDTSNKTVYKKPLVITDGLIALDIINIMAKNNLPSNCFCPTGIPPIAKSVLSDYLKVQCNEINRTYVWGVNDLHFHVEVEKPFVVYDVLNDHDDCSWEMVSQDILEPANLDHTRFNASWMKKEYINKIKHLCAENPYGNIYKAWQMADVLFTLWKARSGTTQFKPLGVCSDGSVGTVKGLPYILPVLLSEDSWKIDQRFEELTHLRQEIKSYNEIARKHHDKLVKYCDKFLTENIINQAFVPADDESDFTFSSLLEQSDQ